MVAYAGADHYHTNVPETEFDFDVTNHPQKSLLARSLRLVLGAVGRSKIPSPRTRRLRGLNTDGYMHTYRPRDIQILVTCWVHNFFRNLIEYAYIYMLLLLSHFSLIHIF